MLLITWIISMVFASVFALAVAAFAGVAALAKLMVHGGKVEVDKWLVNIWKGEKSTMPSNV